METAVAEIGDVFMNQSSMPKDYYLGELLQKLESVIKCRPEAIFSGRPEDAQDPSSLPSIWISRWVDYTEEYGFGYQLCGNSIGMFFNDATHLILLQDGENLQYVEQNNQEHHYLMHNPPPEMSKKITTLNHFKTYMNNYLVGAGGIARPREGKEIASVPHLRAWFRTKSAIIFHLTNGTFQANFFKDHTKIILYPLEGTVSLIDEHKNFTLYTLQLIEKHGCSPLLASRLRYSKSMVEKLYKDFQTSELNTTYTVSERLEQFRI